jgi:hypothetical protein
MRVLRSITDGDRPEEATIVRLSRATEAIHLNVDMSILANQRVYLPLITR